LSHSAVNKRAKNPHRITSYINNLHPQKEKSLYEIISQLITASIPLWELTLAPLLKGNNFSRGKRIAYRKVQYESYQGLNRTEYNDDDEGSGDEPWYGDDNMNPDEELVILRPEPKSFKPLPSPPKLDLREVYGKRGLQVIVKLANIELTPDKPEYDGGSWHVEGQLVSFYYSFARSHS
jgi:Protein of unknown function (DUF4246)